MAVLEIDVECEGCGNELKCSLQDANFIIVVKPCENCMATGQHEALESYNTALERAHEKVAEKYDIL